MANLKIISNPDNCTGCRVCQLICSFVYYQEFNPSKSNIIILDEYELTPIIKFSEECNNCGQCAKNCLYGALTLVGDTN